VPVNETDLISPVDETQKSSSPSFLLSSAALVGSLVEGACAILVASASAKIFLALGAVAGAVKASRLHADIVRIPVLLASAAAALITLLVLWNAWRARKRSAARWRKKTNDFARNIQPCRYPLGFRHNTSSGARRSDRASDLPYSLGDVLAAAGQKWTTNPPETTRLICSERCTGMPKLGFPNV
jgi:hypothetical protein